MRPLDDLDPAILSRCVAVLTDIDDTLTTDGVVPEHVVAAIARLKDCHAEAAVVQQTGSRQPRQPRANHHNPGPHASHFFSLTPK